MRFENKVALVTGASVGIGRAVAIKMASEGAKVIVVDINEETLAKVEEELKQYTEDILAVKCDVSSQEKVNNVIGKGYEKFGRIDILVNNAAIWRDQISFLETPVELWEKYINVNIMSVVYFMKGVLGKMVENKYGRIVNVASVAGVYGNRRMSHYSATKAAVIALTKSIAKEVAKDGVTINSTSPGTVSSSKNKDINSYEETDTAKYLTYMERTGSDMENANLICFLASDEAPYLSGENIIIDGVRKSI